jgi:hypothetical protein
LIRARADLVPIRELVGGSVPACSTLVSGLSLDQEAFALRLLSRSVNQSLSHRNFSMDPYCFCISSGNVFKYSGLFSGTAIAIERSPQTSAAGSGERHAE